MAYSEVDREQAVWMVSVLRETDLLDPDVQLRNIGNGLRLLGVPVEEAQITVQLSDQGSAADDDTKTMELSGLRICRSGKPEVVLYPREGSDGKTGVFFSVVSPEPIKHEHFYPHAGYVRAALSSDDAPVQHSIDPAGRATRVPIQAWHIDGIGTQPTHCWGLEFWATSLPDEVSRIEGRVKFLQDMT